MGGRGVLSNRLCQAVRRHDRLRRSWPALYICMYRYVPPGKIRANYPFIKFIIDDLRTCCSVFHLSICTSSFLPNIPSIVPAVSVLSAGTVFPQKVTLLEIFLVIRPCIRRRVTIPHSPLLRAQLLQRAFPTLRLLLL